MRHEHDRVTRMDRLLDLHRHHGAHSHRPRLAAMGGVMNKHELRALEAIERNRQLRKRNAELLAALQVAMNFLDTNDNDERQAYMDCRAAVRTATEGPADDGALPIPGPGAS